MTRKPACNVCDCGRHAWAPATLSRIAIVDYDDRHLLERFAWYTLSPERLTPYAASGKAPNHIGHRLLHRAVLNLACGQVADHRNGNGLDCRRDNLRPCTQLQNTHNRRPMRGSTSRHRGVSWRTVSNSWVAQICIMGRNRRIGEFHTETDAARAYDAEAVKEFGEFARLNFQAARV